MSLRTGQNICRDQNTLFFTKSSILSIRLNYILRMAISASGCCLIVGCASISEERRVASTPLFNAMGGQDAPVVVCEIVSRYFVDADRRYLSDLTSRPAAKIDNISKGWTAFSISLNDGGYIVLNQGFITDGKFSGWLDRMKYSPRVESSTSSISDVDISSMTNGCFLFSENLSSDRNSTKNHSIYKSSMSFQYCPYNPQLSQGSDSSRSRDEYFYPTYSIKATEHENAYYNCRKN